MRVVVWLGGAAPVRSIRWLDGTLAAAAQLAASLPPRGAGGSEAPTSKLETPTARVDVSELAPTGKIAVRPSTDGITAKVDAAKLAASTVKIDDGRLGEIVAIAAGSSTWLDLAADRAGRVGLGSIGITTDLNLDYLGWAQVIVAAARRLGARTVLVDEASRPHRWIEVAAIAELLDVAQLTHVVALAADGQVVHASRVAGRQLQTLRVRGDAVIGMRVAGPPLDEYPTPMPATTQRRVDFAALGLDPKVLAHRAIPSGTQPQPRRTVERVAEHLAVHRPPRREGAE